MTNYPYVLVEVSTSQYSVCFSGHDRLEETTGSHIRAIKIIWQNIHNRDDSILELQEFTGHIVGRWWINKDWRDLPMPACYSKPGTPDYLSIRARTCE